MFDIKYCTYIVFNLEGAPHGINLSFSSPTNVPNVPNDIKTRQIIIENEWLFHLRDCRLAGESIQIITYSMIAVSRDRNGDNFALIATLHDL